MHRILLTAALATVVAGTAAQAASRHKHHHRHQAYVAAQVAPARVGPVWAGPNQCFTDEGYGRYASCDGSGKN